MPTPTTWPAPTRAAGLPEAARIAVFAKAPVAGEAKTRLIPLLGADGAAALQAGLVRHALATATRAAPGRVDLWCAPGLEHPFFQRCAKEFGVRLFAQQGDDLGQRMRHALRAGLAEARGVIVIGSDCPALEVADLTAAAAALREVPVAIAPAEDGGYVLLAMSHPHDALLEGIDWGTAAVMGQTRARLAAMAVAWKELPARWDVDRPADYARLQAAGLLREVLS